MINNFRTPKLDIKRNILAYDLYQDGFQFYGLENDPSHDINTRIFLSFLNDSPEKFLLTLAKRAYVVCLSATAEEQTVTGNFDIPYIRENLGPAFYTLPAGKFEELKAHYLKERSNPHEVLVTSFRVESKEDPESSVFEGGLLERFKATLAPFTMPEIPGKDGKFQTNRFCCLAQAIRAFTQDLNSHALLVVANMNLRTYPDNIYCLPNIQCVVDLAMQEQGIPEADRPLIVSMASNDFESKKRQYLEEMRNGGRVILMTSYPTASTGQNLQYEMELDGEFRQLDIDSIYLEYPRNLVTRVTYESEDSDVLRFIYQVLALRGSGEITTSYAGGVIEQAFRSKGRAEVDERPSKTIYATDSVNYHAVIFLKQAIGRINRTKNKGKTHIYLEGTIYDKVSFQGEESRMQTLDFMEVVKNSHAERPDKTYLKKLNKAVFRCRTIQSQISKLMERRNGVWVLANMEEWQRIRDFVLRHPTITQEELNENPEMRYLYLEAGQGNLGLLDHYFASFKEDDCEKVSWICYLPDPEKKDLICFDSRMCGLDELMKVSYVRSYFIKNGYATKFEPAEYILLPNIMRNIYMGALGEAAGKCVFDGKIGHRLVEISDPRKFEKFDFQLEDNSDIYIDFKNWSPSTRVDGEAYEKKCSDKLDEVGGQVLLVVNIFSTNGNRAYRSKVDKRIVIIPRLIMKTARGAYSTDNDMCGKIDAYLGMAAK